LLTYATDGFAQKNGAITLKTQDSYSISKSVFVIEDKQGKFTVRDIVSHYRNGQIKRLNDKDTIGLEPVPNWIVFELNNQTNSENWFIDFGDLSSSRVGTINRYLVYEATQKELFLDGLSNTNSDINTLQKKSSLPITIQQGKNSLFVIYFYPTDYKKSFIPLRIKPSATPVINNFNSFIINSTSVILIASLIAILLGFFITNAVGFIPIIIYYGLTLIWFQYAEIPLFANFIGISIFAPLIPIILSLLIGISCLFTVPARYSAPPKRIFLFTTMALGIVSIFALSFTDPFGSFSKYDLSVIIGSITLLACILFLSDNKSPYLKKTNICLSAWVVLVLIGLMIPFLAANDIIGHHFLTVHTDKLLLLPQLIAVFIGIIISIKTEQTRMMVNYIRKNQRTTSLLNAQKNKENSDHSRLLRVIEREREIMEELRARETERTEEMRNAKIVADEANQAKSAFLAVVSHEIRTPMTGIMGMVKMLEDTSLSDEQKDYIMTIGDSGQAMLALLNDILDFSKIEDGAMDLENIEFDLRRVLNSVTMLMKAHSDQKNLQLILNIDDDIPQKLYGDPTRLRQILLNLVGNAIKFTSKGHVAIIANYDGNGQDIHNVQFEVSDTGLGISKEAQENLFTPFAQADSSISRRYGGTGLGLAICKTLVEAMGGTIAIKSREGAGSTFHFGLPFTSEFMKKPAETQKPTNEILEDLRFMVVDDNEINRKVIDGFLKKYNHTVVLLESGRDALDILETDQKFDALFLDIEMPGMSGIDLAQHIKQDASVKNIPLIAITGNVSDDDISRYKNAGFSDHVAKPIEIEELNRAIAQTQTSPAPQKNMVDSEPQKIKITPSKKTSEKKALNPAVGKTLDEVMLKGLKEGLGSKQTNDLIAELFIKADEIVGQLVDLKDTEDKDSARMRAHELKGMAGNFGLKALSDKSDEIEQICKDSERPFSDIIPHIEDLSTLVERSRYAVKEFLGD